MKRILGATIALALTGCGADMRQFAIAQVNKKVVVGPNAQCGEAPDRISTTRVNEDNVYTVYEGASGKFYLVTEEGTFEGALANGAYTFKGEDLYEEIKPGLDNQRSKEVGTKTWQYVLTPDDGILGNGTVKGTFQKTDKQQCIDLNGNRDCQGGSLSKTKECITTADLQGTELDSASFVRGTSVPNGTGPKSP